MPMSERGVGPMNKRRVRKTYLAPHNCDVLSIGKLAVRDLEREANRVAAWHLLQEVEPAELPRFLPDASVPRRVQQQSGKHVCSV